MKRPNSTTSTSGYASTAQVARALGVSVTTVKRWVDDGILPALKSPGGHRKILLADVALLVREGKLPQGDLAPLLPKVSAPKRALAVLRDALTAAVQAIDSEAIRSLMHGLHEHGVPVAELADEWITPCLRQVGLDWEHGRTTVLDEHRITQAFVAALYDLKSELSTPPDPARPVGLGGAPEGDHYILPTLLAKMTLLDAGWNAINIGPNTPFAALREAVEQSAPRLVWLSVSYLADEARFEREYREFFRFAEKHDLAVALGGQALTESLRGQLPYTTFGDGFQQLASFAKMLHVRPSRPKRGRPIGSGKK